MGEQEFIKLTNGLTEKKKNDISELIVVGLEYGDNNYDNEIDHATIDNTFPNLQKALSD